MDGGSCLHKTGEKDSLVRKSLAEQYKVRKEEPRDPLDMTPYQKHMKHNRFKSTAMDED